ncbi:MAG: AAA family ATPase [Dermatophilaceae bacterium]
MLTRLEVRGFKNLREMSVDFGPFTCIAGPNGIGKSNVFDAIQFLSVLATETFVDAVQRVRGAAGARAGDPRDVFSDGEVHSDSRLHLAAEMLVPARVEDDLGEEAEASTTFLRYEVNLGYEPPSGQGSVGRLSLLAESLTHITKGNARSHLRFAHKPAFRDAVVVGKRQGGAFLSTEERDGGTVINVHGDGGSRGKPQPRAAGRAGRTVLSTVLTNENPTILAARREMQSWRRLALEPSALRTPDELSAPRSIDPDGRHLAATLYRIAHAHRPERDPDPEAVYARVAGRLSDLVGTEIQGIEVELDPVREVFTLFVVERGALRLPARALSEGTLRFLALSVLLEDPELHGLICMEEPENGIHPANLGAILDLVRDLAVDPMMVPSVENPMRQVIINTHSPGVVQLCDEQDLLLAETRQHFSVVGTKIVRSLVLVPYQNSWRHLVLHQAFSKADVLAYLTGPPGGHLQLPQEFGVS